MPKLDIHAIEKKWKKYWEDKKIYVFNQKSNKKIFAIDTPPPTVSGKMHIGHASSYSQQDFIARYKRMQGFNVFQPFGTDDNGLPTEKLVEKTKGLKSKDMSREQFIKTCLTFLKKEAQPNYIEDWKNIGISCDWTKVYSTIDDNARKLSQQSFIELYKQKRIYKEAFPTIWDTEFQTPVAQAELEDKEQETFFTTLKFTTQGKMLPIATTRPELLGACLAVFVNPKDKRYKQLIGNTAIVPLFNHEVPIIADESAEIDKGTGVLMVCSYGDKYDVDAVTRLKLTPKIIIEKDGTLNIPPYQGLPIKKARAKILEDLKTNKLIIDQKKITHATNVYEKSGREIEFLPTEQWFIKVLDKKKELIRQGKQIQWKPAHMQKRYENWITGLEWDWSISRERHFGVPIPVWFCPENGHTILAEDSELPVDPTQTKKICTCCNKEAIPENKVLDTWATSSLTPQIANSLIKNKLKLPYALRPQAHDIIRTWAFYTIVKSYFHEQSIPWENIAISGFVTLKGQKMSKSKGNIVQPQTITEKYGADALRYWAATSKLGEDYDYQEKDVITGTKFLNKIANATNFVFLNLTYQKTQPTLHETDRLFLTQLNELIKKATAHFEDYNYAAAKLATEKFFWRIFADNYLEIIKNRIYNGTKEEKASASYTLYHALLTIIKLFAPITPFITEEIYQQHFKAHEKTVSIHIADWPEPLKVKTTKDDDKTWNKVLEVISQVRNKKSIAQKSMKAEITLTLPKTDTTLLNNTLDDLKAVTGATTLNEGKFNVEFVEG